MSVYEQLVMPDIAQLLKEIGFKEDTVFGYNRDNILRHKLTSAVSNGHACISWERYDNDLRVPFLYEAQAWLTATYNIHFSIIATHLEEAQPRYNYSVFIRINGLVRIEAQGHSTVDFGAALTTAMYKAIIAIKRHNLIPNEEAQEEKVESVAL